MQHDDGVIIEPLRELAQQPRVTATEPDYGVTKPCGCIYSSKRPNYCYEECPIHLWEGEMGRRYDGPLTMPKPKARIRWGNVAAYLSLLALAGVMLWILVAYTNTPR